MISVKPAGATPTTVKSAPFSVSVFPSIAGSEPRCCCQKARLSTITRCGGGTRASSCRNVRPRTSFTPRGIGRAAGRGRGEISGGGGSLKKKKKRGEETRGRREDRGEEKEEEDNRGVRGDQGRESVE